MYRQKRPHAAVDADVATDILQLIEGEQQGLLKDFSAGILISNGAFPFTCSSLNSLRRVRHSFLYLKNADIVC